MIEVEVKARIRDLEIIKRRLQQQGFTLMKTVHQKDIYLQPNFRDFQETGEVLRVRKQAQDSDVITYKGSRLISRIKARKEIEIKVENGDKILELFKKLEFKPWIIVEKDRAMYKSGNFEVSIDNVRGLGSYIEIETQIDNSDPETEQEILRMLDRLGIPEEAIEKKTYLELARERVK